MKPKKMTEIGSKVHKASK
jgi:hypothetical protein